MAVLITGATGMIGRVLARGLADAGLGVTVLTRRPHRAQEAFGDKVKAYEWHPINQAVPPQAMEGINCIVHLMGDEIAGKPTPRKLARLSASRVVATRRLIEASVAARSASDMRMILASSAAIYPGRTTRQTTAVGSGDVALKSKSKSECELNGLAGTSGICEDAQFPVDPASELANAITQWEAAADPLRESGGSVACVRLGQVISAASFPRPLVDLHERRMLVRIPPDAIVPAITLEDAAALFAWLVLNRKVAGPLNGVAPVPLTGKAIMDVLLEPDDGRIVASLPVWMSARALGLLAGQTLGDCHVTPQKALDAGFAFSQRDPLEAVRRAVTAQRKAIQQGKARRLPPWMQRPSASKTQATPVAASGEHSAKTNQGKAPLKTSLPRPVLPSTAQSDKQT